MEHAQLSEVRHFLGVFAFIGGSGATLSLVAAILLVCRHRALRMLAYAGLAVGLLGVNEVLLFGLPIILNPRLLAPFLLAPLVNVLLAWGAVSLGWVAMPSVAVPMTSPLGLNAYLATEGDWGAVWLQLGLIAIGATLYAPFVRRYERLDIDPPVIDLPGLETTYSRLQEAAELREDDPLNQAQAHRERLNQRHQRMREISTQRFFMAYQPKVALPDGHFTGGEALLRYQGADGQTRSAGLYVEWLREAGLIKQLDLWVARAVVEQDKRWKAQGLLCQTSINVTQATLVDPARRTELLALLARTDGRVSVEITEDALIQDVGQMSEAIERLHAVGAQVQIDDFGTGYSALSHLHRFPIDTIKIDRSFVLASATERGNTVMQGVIALVQRLGLKVVVEGVETEAQLAVLRPHGDIQVQGWYFSQALAPDAFAAFARQHASQKAVEQLAAVAVEG
jgi:EAL domain-containing protein (putative c-di-GMP-specific phosphodiesterase class I)